MKRVELVLLALLSVSAAGPAAALSSDREQPAHIRAERAEIDDRTGVSRYIGRVELDQGTLHVEADTLEVHHRDGEVSRIIADGAPVRFRQRPEGADADLHGRAAHIEYEPATDTLTLVGDARLRQDQDEFTGERIVYDTVAGTVQARGGTEDGDGRVHAIIHPKQGPAGQ